MSQQLTDFLKKYKPLIPPFREHWAYGYKGEVEHTVPWNPLTADQWQEFKRVFVQEYGGETVQADGLTHRELLRYLRDGSREGDEYFDDNDWL